MLLFCEIPTQVFVKTLHVFVKVQKMFCPSNLNHFSRGNLWSKDKPTLFCVCTVQNKQNHDFKTYKAISLRKYNSSISPLYRW